MGAVGIGIQEGNGEHDQGKDQFLDPESVDHLLDLQSFRKDEEDGQEEYRIAERKRQGDLGQDRIAENKHRRFILPLEHQHAQAAENQKAFEQGRDHLSKKEATSRSKTARSCPMALRIRSKSEHNRG